MRLAHIGLDRDRGGNRMNHPDVCLHREPPFNTLLRVGHVRAALTLLFLSRWRGDQGSKDDGAFAGLVLADRAVRYSARKCIPAYLDVRAGGENSATCGSGA